MAPKAIVSANSTTRPGDAAKIGAAGPPSQLDSPSFALTLKESSNSPFAAFPKQEDRLRTSLRGGASAASMAYRSDAE